MHYKSLIDHMHNGFIYVEVVYDKEQPVDFIPLEVNDAFEAMTGIKGVQGKKISEIFPDSSAASVEFIKRFARVAESGTPERFELSFEHLQKWFDTTVYCPEKGFLVAVIDDITIRKDAENELRKSEERFKALFNSHSAIQVLLDPDTGKVVDVNQKAALWYGWSVDELKQMYTKDINTLTPEEIIKSLHSVETGQHNKFIGRHRRKDGSIRDVEIFRTKIELDGRPVIHVITHDITERKLAEAELQRLTRALIASNDCNHALLHTNDERALLQKICSIIVKTGGYRMAWVGYAVSDTAKSIQPVAYAGISDDYFSSLHISWADDEYGQGPAGTAIRTGKPFTVNNIKEDPKFAYWVDEAAKRGYTSIHSEPLQSDDSVFGVLTVYSEQSDAFTPRESELLAQLAKNLAYGISVLRNRTALKKSEIKFKSLFEQHSAIMLIVDPVTNTIIHANESAANFYGWSIKELCQMSTSQLGSRPSDISRQNKDHCRSSSTTPFECRHTLKDGSVRDVEIFTNHMDDLYYWVINDITSRKLYIQLNTFRIRIVEMAETHSVEKLLMLTLDEAEKITGSSIGFMFFVSEDQNDLHLQAVSTNTLQNMCNAVWKGQHYPLSKAGIWADAARERKPIIHNEYHVIECRNGIPEVHAEIKRELVIPVIRDDRVMATLGVGNKEKEYDEKDIEGLNLLANIIWDIVAKKIAEEEKNVIASQLQHAVKMEMIGQLAAGIAHEINNPLNFITLNNHNLESDFNDISELVAQYRHMINKVETLPVVTNEIEQIRNKEHSIDIDELLGNIPKAFESSQYGIDRIASITRSIRNYSFKNINGTLCPFDINQAIKDTLFIVNNESQSFVHIALQLDSLPLVECDPSQINQVILNLIINSIQAIKSQKRSSLGQIEVKTWAANKSVYCSVTDDGPGIPEKIKYRVFEPFFTTRELGNGTGLGLSISYDIIVNKHKGLISVDAPPCGGAVFTFSLPITEPKS
jgi:PAS domain S-box-containing protein